jgi:hypothetical protein
MSDGRSLAPTAWTEGMNTAFEHLCDVVQPDFHASVKVSKDIAAGAVLADGYRRRGIGRDDLPVLSAPVTAACGRRGAGRVCLKNL